MEGNRISQGDRYGRVQTYLTTTRSMFTELRDQIYQSWNDEGFRSLDQALFMCEIVYLSTLRPERVAHAAAIKTKNYRENRKRGYEVQIEGSYQGGKFQMEREPAQSGDTIHVQASVEEAPDKKQEE